MEWNQQSLQEECCCFALFRHLTTQGFSVVSGRTGKTSNYTVMKMPISVCCASIELKGQLDTKKITNHCCFFFREESILKVVQTKNHSSSGSYRIGLSSENVS